MAANKFLKRTNSKPQIYIRQRRKKKLRLIPADMACFKCRRWRASRWTELLPSRLKHPLGSSLLILSLHSSRTATSKWTYERKINVFLGVKPVHPAEKGFTFENSALILLIQGEKHSCSLTDAAQGRRVLKRAE